MDTNIEVEKEVVRKVCFTVFQRMKVKKPLIVFETNERSVYWIVIYSNVDVVDIIADSIRRKVKPRWVAKVLPVFFEGNECLYLDFELLVFAGRKVNIKVREMYDIIDLGDRFEFDKLDVVPLKIETTKMRWAY